MQADPSGAMSGAEEGLASCVETCGQTVFFLETPGPQENFKTCIEAGQSSAGTPVSPLDFVLRCANQCFSVVPQQKFASCVDGCSAGRSA